MTMLRGTPQPEFQCMECGKAFYSFKAAEKAADVGCPICGGVDVDVFVSVEQRTNLSEDEKCQLKPKGL